MRILLDELVSVIIPAYNVEKYISQCVRSVLSQTYHNLEVIIVNDGSSDDTEAICKSLLSTDNRITVIRQDHRGLSVARNAGYEKSRGKWICYIDSDDWIEDSFIETLVHLAAAHHADIAACKSRNVDEQGLIKESDNDTHEVYEYQGKEIIKSLCGSCNNIRFEVWNKVWKRDLINEIRFIEGQVSEDVHFDRIAFMRACKIVYKDTTLYNYRFQRPGNLHSSFHFAQLCIFHEFDLWMKEMTELGWTREVRKLGAFSCNMAIAIYHKAVCSRQKKAIIERIRSEYNRVYPYIKDTEEDRMKYRVFSISPAAYHSLSSICRLLKCG